MTWYHDWVSHRLVLNIGVKRPLVTETRGESMYTTVFTRDAQANKESRTKLKYIAFITETIQYVMQNNDIAHESAADSSLST